jgi:hypothetical protein
MPKPRKHPQRAPQRHPKRLHAIPLKLPPIPSHDHHPHNHNQQQQADEGVGLAGCHGAGDEVVAVVGEGEWLLLVLLILEWLVGLERLESGADLPIASIAPVTGHAHPPAPTAHIDAPKHTPIPAPHPHALPPAVIAIAFHNHRAN